MTEPEASPQSMEELVNEMDKMESLEVGRVLKGTVIQIDQSDVFVDTGRKNESRVPVDEFEEAPETGKEYEFLVIGTYAGVPKLSRRKLKENIERENIRACFQDGTAVEGTLVKTNKGGFDVELPGRIRAFLPLSFLGGRRKPDLKGHLGEKRHFYVEKFEEEKSLNIVLNNKKFFEEESRAKKDEFYAEVRIGDVREGIVKSFAPFGVFVDLGGFDGLLHMNDVSWGHVARPKDFLELEQKINLKVINIDREKDRIGLSLKAMEDDPLETFLENHDPGDTVTGRVRKLMDFGAFVEVAPAVEGLLHVSELAWTRHVKHPKEVLKVGDSIETKILSCDRESRKLSLGLKQLLPNPWDNLQDSYPVGTRLKRKIVKVMISGALVELEDGITGFLHVDNYSWTQKIKNAFSVFKEGEEIEFVILSVNKEDNRIELGTKQLLDDPWKKFKKTYSIGSIIEGTITKITDFGLFLRVDMGLEGLVRKQHLDKKSDEDPDFLLQQHKEGETLQVIVIEFDPSRQKLGLSLKGVEKAREKKEVSKYLSSSKDSASGNTLKDMLEKDSFEKNSGKNAEKNVYDEKENL